MRIYLDWNATTPPRAEVLDAMRAAAERAWANPSSVHADGRSARAIVEDARACIAQLAGVDPRDVVFTSGGTESNNLALRTHALHVRTIVTSRLEHPSITRVAEALEREGRVVRWCRVTPGGVIDLDHLRALLRETDSALVTVQAVNHETGVLGPIDDVVALAPARLHVDAVQAWGKVDVAGGWDTASFGAHKMRGPKGIGALAMRAGVKLEPHVLGGEQERGVRPGTIDAALAAGFGEAVRRASIDRWAAIAALRDALEVALGALGGVPVGDASRRAPHVTNLTFDGWVGAELVAALDLEGLSVSSGSACSAGTAAPSPVLEAMLGAARAKSGVRLSLGDTTTVADVDACVAAFRTVLGRSVTVPKR
jgi:cysteine desulfurase